MQRGGDLEGTRRYSCRESIKSLLWTGVHNPVAMSQRLMKEFREASKSKVTRGRPLTCTALMLLQADTCRRH